MKLFETRPPLAGWPKEPDQKKSVEELLETLIALIILEKETRMADTVALTAAVAALTAVVPEVVTEFGVLSAPDGSQPDIDAATAAVTAAVGTLTGLVPAPVVADPTEPTS